MVICTIETSLRWQNGKLAESVKAPDLKSGIGNGT